MTNNQNCEVCDRLDCPTLTMPDMPDWCKDRDRMKLLNADYGWWASNRNKIQQIVSENCGPSFLHRVTNEKQ